MNKDQVYIPNTAAGDRQFLEQAASISQIINSKGWQILRTYWHHKREELIAELEKSKSERKWEFYKGQLYGFREALEVPEKILAQAEQLTNQENLEEVYGNGES